MEKVRYQSAFTFQYSPREGTPAAQQKEIPADVMRHRFQRLVDLQNSISLEIAEHQVGREFSVLVEGSSEHQDESYTGRTSENWLINFEITEELLHTEGLSGLSKHALGDELEGCYIKVRVDHARTFSLNATAIEIISLPAGMQRQEVR